MLKRRNRTVKKWIQFKMFCPLHSGSLLKYLYIVCITSGQNWIKTAVRNSKVKIVVHQKFISPWHLTYPAISFWHKYLIFCLGNICVIRFDRIIPPAIFVYTLWFRRSFILFYNNITFQNCFYSIWFCRY